MSTSTAELWVRALDDLESLIDRQTAAIDDGAALSLVGDELTFRVPVGLPPLPAHLAARADRLRRVNEALIERTRALTAEAAPRQQATHRHPTARLSTPRFDHRA